MRKGLRAALSAGPTPHEGKSGNEPTRVKGKRRAETGNWSGMAERLMEMKVEAKWQTR